MCGLPPPLCTHRVQCSEVRFFYSYKLYYNLKKFYPIVYIYAETYILAKTLIEKKIQRHFFDKYMFKTNMYRNKSLYLLSMNNAEFFGWG